MTNENSEQLNTAIEEPDYRALYFAQLEQDNFKDTVIAGQADSIKDLTAKNDQQQRLIRQKNKKIAEYEASDVKSTNRDKIKQREKTLNLEDQVTLYKAAARQDSKPEDVARIAELEEQVAGYKQMEQNYLDLQKSFDANQQQHDLAIKNQQMIMFAYNKAQKEIASLKQCLNGDVVKEFDRLHAIIDKLTASGKTKDESLEACFTQITSMQNQIDDLKQEVTHWKTLCEHHSGITNQPPSTDTPGHKAERKAREHDINLREKTDKKPGGQENHPGSSIKLLADNLYDEINEELADLPLDKMSCPYCRGKDIERTDESYTRTEIGIKFITYLNKITLHACRCKCCGRIVNSEEIQKFKEAPCVYSADVKAFADYLMNVCNLPVNKVVELFDGISKGRLVPSPGWICKNNDRLAELAKPFYDDLRYEMIKQRLLQWDDTVIPINGANANLRVYSNEYLAFYAAHLHKGLASIFEDGILNHISIKTIVVHDDCCTNYSKTLHFIHSLCIIHFMRHLLKLSCDTKHKVWEEMKDLIMKALEKRKDLIGEEQTAFSPDDIETFKKKFMELIAKAEMENERDSKLHPKEKFFRDERKYLKKIHRDYDRFFLWLTDFSIPPDNNLCERSLRPVKSKTKQSGQFKSLDGAKAYAIIKSYMDTCRRNGIARYAAMKRLAEGTPYTLAEILGNRAA